ncbi:HNH endonuclease [Pragia fontium]|uniref:HNH endonuclease n=1 Tax=Pragia fontium DSM 5563 = ATCC 49100 TaxID=1122977 RepID=A0AAJ5BI10_9GAMM|nr:HNH endonuclease [Pragia fontium]SFD16161.1 HNH endonuclease [Pragia fontium DSM 5563 = ATCC 49100]SUB80966.1 Uncharacterised protein [Pragia fontium]VEJ52783.1 Uncharacterised protein [Pragia fontium]
MPSKYVKLRVKAAIKQSFRCYYCNTVMWEYSISQPSKMNRLQQCTAEHLIPKSKKGRDIASNIVAACQFCNHTRHKAKKILPPDKYKEKVQRRIKQGKWY